jgi:hypothetical protein
VAAAGRACRAAAAAAAVAAGGGAEGGQDMITTMNLRLRRHLMASMLAMAVVLPLPSALGQEASLFDYKSAEAPRSFDDPAKAVDAFKAAVAAGDFDGLARLIGLDPAKLRSSDGVMDTFDKIRKGAAEKVEVEDAAAGRKIIDVGKQVWPFPFPLTEKDGKWAFDTEAGIEEIINRRVGENELEAIETMRAYVDAQRDYASRDRDGDGVLEYAQKLISSEGQTDGLYWPTDDVNGESPAGDSISEAALEKAKEGKGYYGYRFRILKGQGANVAGGRYDYVINGNMIAGFGLIAWPVTYGETGVNTFVVNQAGIVYEKDLGPRTSAIVEAIDRFNPDKSWTISEE